MMDIGNVTPFSDIYNVFFSKITDDFYMEMTKEDTEAAAQDLLLSAIPSFEFPRVPLDYILDDQFVDQNGNVIVISHFTHRLSPQEQNILATYMVVAWIGQQLASVELTRMKYSGSDFKFTSQANHLAKLNQLKKDYTTEGFHLQRLYKRRFKDSNGVYHSTMTKIMEPLAPLPKGKAPNPREGDGIISRDPIWKDMDGSDDPEKRSNRVGRIVEGDDGS